MMTNGFNKMISQRFGGIYIYRIIAQVACTEIIQSAVADVADMAAISDNDPNKKCPVLCALSRVNLHKSATQSNFRTTVYILHFEPAFPTWASVHTCFIPMHCLFIPPKKRCAMIMVFYCQEPVI